MRKLILFTLVLLLQAISVGLVVNQNDKYEALKKEFDQFKKITEENDEYNVKNLGKIKSKLGIGNHIEWRGGQIYAGKNLSKNHEYRQREFTLGRTIDLEK